MAFIWVSRALTKFMSTSLGHSAKWPFGEHIKKYATPLHCVLFQVHIQFGMVWLRFSNCKSHSFHFNFQCWSWDAKVIISQNEGRVCSQRCQKPKMMVIFCTQSPTLSLYMFFLVSSVDQQALSYTTQIRCFIIIINQRHEAHTHHRHRKMD